jgi:hypothetical protein
MKYNLEISMYVIFKRRLQAVANNMEEGYAQQKLGREMFTLRRVIL